MKYKDAGYNRLLVGDLYHWQLDINGDIQENESAKQ
jgi:hypothetical protein